MNFKKSYFLLFCLAFFVCFPVFSRPGDRYISVKEIEAKSSPSIWGKENGTFYYGDKVRVLESKGSWIKVSNNGASGWIKESCVTSRKINSDRIVSVDADEIALAGKGFSNSLEAQYSDSYNIDFDVVDYVEKLRLSDKALHDFIVDGKLKGAE